MTCSECTLMQWCGRVTSPTRTGRPCPHFVQWRSKWAWVAEQAVAVENEVYQQFSWAKSYLEPGEC